MSISTMQMYIKDVNEAMESIDTKEVEELFGKLYQLEIRFSKKLRSIGGGKQVYHTFITFIREHPNGILAARPYFREREDNYKLTVNYAIDHTQPKMLHEVKINFQFCKFAIDALKAAEKENLGLIKIFQELKIIREQIINRYLLVAMHNAKRHNKKPSPTIEFSDLVQTANEGLIAAVDKYVLEENGTEFHMVAIGRMVASLINSSYLNLSVSIGPHASKKLYRIKRILEKLPNAKADEIAKIIEATDVEVSDLIAASSYMSLDKEFEGTDLRMVDTLAHPVDNMNDPYLMVERRDLMDSLQNFMNTLTLMERKILTLKGVQGILEEVQVEDLK